jgi:antitoxin (DNA-binding transcriptional repressor) of toxin-antitoxin stability system
MSHVFNMHSAKTNLSKLIELVEAGEEVSIARAGQVIVELHLAKNKRKFSLEDAPNLLEYIADDFDSPLPEGTWGDYEGALGVKSSS